MLDSAGGDRAGDGKRDLVDAAAQTVGPVPGVGDVPAYVRAYYRHVADDDLAAAGPQRPPRPGDRRRTQRLAAVAREHAELAAQRPQGRAIVAVRPGGDAVLDPGSDVIDIVTDDMPFLVDSITMELTNHSLSARVVVHPQLLVRRDVTGAMSGVAGLVNGVEPTHDELAESWTHIEVARLDGGEAKDIGDDLQRVLGDVRVAVEDGNRMRARAVYLADELLGGTDGGEEEPDQEIGALLRWLADGRFTFLGYREYDLETCPAPGSASCGTTHRTRARSPCCRPRPALGHSTRGG